MPSSRIALQVSLRASLVVMVALFAGHATLVSAQEGESRAGQITAPSSPIRHPSGTKLTEEQVRGAGVFFQRCSLCHLAKTFGAGGSKYSVFSQLSGSKPTDSCEFMPISKGFSLTWRSLANGMFGDAKINQDKTLAG